MEKLLYASRIFLIVLLLIETNAQKARIYSNHPNHIMIKFKKRFKYINYNY